MQLRQNHRQAHSVAHLSTMKYWAVPESPRRCSRTRYSISEPEPLSFCWKFSPAWPASQGPGSDSTLSRIWPGSYDSVLSTVIYYMVEPRHPSVSSSFAFLRDLSVYSRDSRYALAHG